MLQRSVTKDRSEFKNKLTVYGQTRGHVTSEACRAVHAR